MKLYKSKHCYRSSSLSFALWLLIFEDIEKLQFMQVKLVNLYAKKSKLLDMLLGFL